MISWISGELIESWQTNNKFFILLNCHGIGYEIQILEFFYINLKTNKIDKKNLILWIKHVKKEDSDLLFGFTTKEQKNFFIEVLNIRGIGSQIGMSILNKFSTSEIIDAINKENKKLISSVPGIGQKMTERLIIELKNKFKNELQINDSTFKNEILNIKNEHNKMFDDLQLALKSLNYKNKEIKRILPLIIKEADDHLSKKEIKISFENLLKLAMNYLDNESSNIVR